MPPVTPEASQADTNQPEVHPAIGLAENAIVDGCQIVYERDDSGEVTGWHKKPLTLTEMAALGDAQRPVTEEVSNG